MRVTMRIVLPITAGALAALAGTVPAAAGASARPPAVTQAPAVARPDVVARPLAAAAAKQAGPAYDEPADAIIDTGSNEALNVHDCASVNCTVIGSAPDGQLVQIYCQLYANYSGGWVDGLWGETDLWDQLQPVYDGWDLVTDGYVDTGSNGQVAPTCSA
jgi:hypothetical protein